MSLILLQSRQMIAEASARLEALGPCPPHAERLRLLSHLQRLRSTESLFISTEDEACLPSAKHSGS